MEQASSLCSAVMKLFGKLSIKIAALKFKKLNKRKDYYKTQ